MRNLKRPWTADEDARLRQLLEGGTSFKLVAAKFKRTVGAVKSRSKRLRQRPLKADSRRAGWSAKSWASKFGGSKAHVPCGVEREAAAASG